MFLNPEMVEYWVLRNSCNCLQQRAVLGGRAIVQGLNGLWPWMEIRTAFLYIDLTIMVLFETEGILK